MSQQPIFGAVQGVVGIPYNRLLHPKDVIKTYLLRLAREKGVRLPTGQKPDRTKYYGAFVETPRAGISEHVVYSDVDSMYPFLLVGLNASPETIVGTREALRKSPYAEDDCVWGYIDTRPVKRLDEGESYRQYTDGTYKMVYDPHANSGNGQMKWRDDPNYEKFYYLNHDIKTGFVTEGVQSLIDLKNEYRGTPAYDAIKGNVTNAIYGVLGTAYEDSAFCLYDWRIAESVTLAGRKMIKWTRDALLEHVHDRGFTEAYPAAGDTDSTAIALPSASTRHDALSVVEEGVQWLNEEGYDQFMQAEFGVPPDRHHAGLDLESYAPRLFVPAKDPFGDSTEGVKKRYAQWVTVEDGEEKSEIDITGLEHERSDTAPITQDAQKDFFEAILRNGSPNAKETVFDQLREYAQTVQNGECSVAYVAKRSGISRHPDTYGSATRTPQPIYRGAKYANNELGVTVQAGDTVQMAYVQDTGTYPSRYSAETAEGGEKVDAVALPDITQLPEEFTVDWEKHWVKTVKTPLKPLINTLHWRWSDVLSDSEQVGFDQF